MCHENKISRRTGRDMQKTKLVLSSSPKNLSMQFVIFKPLNYCFEETIGFDVKASFASQPVLRLIR